MRFSLAWLLIPILTSGCRHDLIVMQLDDAITKTALETRRVAGDSVNRFALELSVIHAVQGGVSVPVTPVTIGAQAAQTQSTKVTVELDLKEFEAQTKKIQNLDVTSDVKPTLYRMDSRSGQLTPIAADGSVEPE
jgi:hypothetical protein